MDWSVGYWVPGTLPLQLLPSSKTVNASTCWCLSCPIITLLLFTPHLLGIMVNHANMPSLCTSLFQWALSLMSALESSSTIAKAWHSFGECVWCHRLTWATWLRALLELYSDNIPDTSSNAVWIHTELYVCLAMHRILGYLLYSTLVLVLVLQVVQ